MPDLSHLIEAADLNGLLHAVDGLCADRDWDGLIDLAERCEDAVERGKQLWPIAAHIDYRLALEAPGEIAVSVLGPDSGRFALGPLTEVAASTHAWAELAPHIDDAHTGAFVAQERVLRGEILDGDPRADQQVLEMPLSLLAWEPAYALATYGSDHVEIAEPWEPKSRFVVVEATAAKVIEDPELEAALLDLVQPWTSESNGAARAVVTEGDAASAIAGSSFGPARMTALQPDEAIRWIAWAAASGGAHGRRRGAALGRSMAFYLLSLIAESLSPKDLGAAARTVKWFGWDEGDSEEEGWILRIALEHPDGWAAAIAATDLLQDGES